MWAEKKGINRLKRFEIMYKWCIQIKNTTKVKATSEQKGSGAEWTPHRRCKSEGDHAVETVGVVLKKTSFDPNYWCFPPQPVAHALPWGVGLWEGRMLGRGSCRGRSVCDFTDVTPVEPPSLTTAGWSVQRTASNGKGFLFFYSLTIVPFISNTWFVWKTKLLIVGCFEGESTDVTKEFIKTFLYQGPVAHVMYIFKIKHLFFCVWVL